MDDSLTLSIGEASDPGLVRRENQDALGYHVPSTPELRRARGALFVVCDGIGGLHAGGHASRLAVDTFLKAYYEGPADAPDALLRRAAAIANDTVFRGSHVQGRVVRMGTTIVAAAMRGAELWVLNIGDSRAYLWRQGTLHQLSWDHAPVGKNTPTDRRINQALGTDPRVKPFLRRPLPLAPGDSVLLCTDGLTTAVPEPAIARTIADFTAPQAARQLIEQAKTAGAHDNVSLLLVGVAAPGMSAPQEAASASRHAGDRMQNLWGALRRLTWADVNPARLLLTQGWRTAGGAALLLAWLALALILGLVVGWLLSR